MSTFISPPSSDPALTAQTFTNNPHLRASLARLKQNPALWRTEAQAPVLQPQAINTGAEVDGSDAAPEPPAPKFDVL